MLVHESVLSRIIANKTQVLFNCINNLCSPQRPVAYLVGGCVRDLLQDRTPKDYDIIIPDERDYLFVTSTIQKLAYTLPQVAMSVVTKNALNCNLSGFEVDIIKLSPDQFQQCADKGGEGFVIDYVNDFDFNINKCWVSSDHKAYYHERFITDLSAKRLDSDKIVGNPCSILKRMLKFIREGYSATPGLLYLLVKTLQDADYDDLSLKDFLTSSGNSS